MSLQAAVDILVGVLALVITALVRSVLRLRDRVTKLEERLRWRRPSRDWPPPDEPE